MKIKNLFVRDFRNLRSIDIDFGNINILTGKNSSGKTNLTQLITNCLNTNDKAKDYFGENIVSHGPGLDSTIIETTIGDINGLFQEIRSTDDGQKKLTIDKFDSFTFKHILSKKTLSSIEQSLDIIGEEWAKTDKDVDFIDKNSELYKEIKFEKLSEKEIYKRKFTISNDGLNNSELIKNGIRYFEMFKTLTEDSIVNRDNNTSFSACSGYIYDFITSKPQNIDTYKEIIDRIKTHSRNHGRQNFKEARFIDLLADIQSNRRIFTEFNDDLKFFTDGIINKVEINTAGSKGFKGDIFITTPHGPSELGYISAGSAIILYFVALKNWLNLEVKDRSYIIPSIMIFDELDQAIHPSLIGRFSELLRIISIKIQFFITTHSTIFVDQFEKKDIYLLKDNGSFDKKVKIKSNILSYETIINELSNDEKIEFMNTNNSDLYINGYIDDIFPLTLSK